MQERFDFRAVGPLICIDAESLLREVRHNAGRKCAQMVSSFSRAPFERQKEENENGSDFAGVADNENGIVYHKPYLSA